MINPAGGGASPVDLEKLEAKINGAQQLIVKDILPQRDWLLSLLSESFQALSELRAWRSQQLTIAGFVNWYYNGPAPDALAAVMALRAIADVLGKPLPASPLPQEATPDDDRTKIKS